MMCFNARPHRAHVWECAGGPTSCKGKDDVGRYITPQYENGMVVPRTVMFKAVIRYANTDQLVGEYGPYGTRGIAAQVGSYVVNQRNKWAAKPVKYVVEQAEPQWTKVGCKSCGHVPE